MEKLGLCMYNEAQVIIKEGQLPLEEANTILHEFLHVIDNIMDLELSEHQITTVATGLMGLFQDNPSFAKFIIKQRTV